MGFTETELHKLHLRIERLENRPLETTLYPAPEVFRHSTVVPEPAVVEAVPGQPSATANLWWSDGRSQSATEVDENPQEEAN